MPDITAPLTGGSTDERLQVSPQDVVTPTTTTITGDSKNSISSGDLPWAIVAQPTTSAGQAGIGNNKHNLQPETWVYGIFLDGDNCQQPLVLGVFPGGNGSGGGGGSTGSGTSDTTGTGSSPSTPPSSSGGTTTPNVNKVFKLLTQHGYTAHQAAGICGSIMQESGGNPNAVNNKTGSHYGIAQWDSHRQAALKRYRPNNWNTIEGQVDFLVHELKTTESKAERMLQNAVHDTTGSAIAFGYFERFGGENNPNNPDRLTRIRNAKKIFDANTKGGQ